MVRVTMCDYFISGTGTLKMRDWKMWHRVTGVENATLENATTYCKGGKFRTGKRGVENARLENAGTTKYGQLNVT